VVEHVALKHGAANAVVLNELLVNDVAIGFSDGRAEVALGGGTAVGVVYRISIVAPGGFVSGRAGGGAFEIRVIARIRYSRI
jgi:hypothetical protein